MIDEQLVVPVTLRPHRPDPFLGQHRIEFHVSPVLLAFRAVRRRPSPNGRTATPSALFSLRGGIA